MGNGVLTCTAGMEAIRIEFSALRGGGRLVMRNLEWILVAGSVEKEARSGPTALAVLIDISTNILSFNATVVLRRQQYRRVRPGQPRRMFFSGEVGEAIEQRVEVWGSYAPFSLKEASATQSPVDPARATLRPNEVPP